MKRNTWAHKLVQRMLDAPWPPCFMDRWQVPGIWSALCGTLRLALHFAEAGDYAHLAVHYVWFSLVFMPYALRIYFATTARRDLVIDVLDLLDMFLASHFISAHRVYGATCALLFIQMGLRPAVVKPMSRQDASLLVDQHLHQHDADVRVLSPAFLGAAALSRKRGAK